MKHALIIALLSILNLHDVCSQNVLFDISGFDEDQTSAYVGVGNRLMVVLEGYMCSEYSLLTDNGDFLEKEKSSFKEEFDNDCVYVWRPEFNRTSNISVISINGNDTIVFGEFQIKTEPLPFKMTIGPYVTGFDCINRIDKNTLLTNAIGIESINLNIQAYSPLISFNVSVLRNDELIYDKQFQKYEAKERELLQSDLSILKNGDVVIFDKIHHKFYEGLDVILDSVKLTIED